MCNVISHLNSLHGLGEEVLVVADTPAFEEQPGNKLGLRTGSLHIPDPALEKSKGVGAT